MDDTPDPLDQQGGTLQVITWEGPDEDTWARITITLNGAAPSALECPSLPSESDTIGGGDIIDCSGASYGDFLVLVYEPSNGMILRHTF